MDARFSSSDSWLKTKDLPGAAFRKWLLSVAPAAVPLYLDSWSWELQPGAKSKDTVIKGLARFKKGHQVGTLLMVSGRAATDTRFYLDALNWKDSPKKDWGKQPYIQWIEKDSTGRGTWRGQWSGPRVEAARGPQHVTFWSTTTPISHVDAASCSSAVGN